MKSLGDVFRNENRYKMLRTRHLSVCGKSTLKFKMFDEKCETIFSVCVLVQSFYGLSTEIYGHGLLENSFGLVC